MTEIQNQNFYTHIQIISKFLYTYPDHLYTYPDHFMDFKNPEILASSFNYRIFF